MACEYPYSGCGGSAMSIDVTFSETAWSDPASPQEVSAKANTPVSK
jgi:hypothetical protein